MNGRYLKAAPKCEYCGGTGETYQHSDDCSYGFCALAGGYEDCRGKVAPCWCVDLYPRISRIMPIVAFFSRTHDRWWPQKHARLMHYPRLGFVLRYGPEYRNVYSTRPMPF